MKTRLIPFDIEKAKQGAKIVTRDGHSVRIGFYDVKNEDFPILGVVQDGIYETPYGFTKDGKINENEDSHYDLFIEEEIEERYMTYYEVAMWLTEKPHRQYKLDGNLWIYSCLSYYEEDGDNIADTILIRENGGEWHKPLVEVKQLKDNNNEEV